MSIAPPSKVVVPELPDAKSMLKATRDAWAKFWASSLATVLVPESDLPALVRLFQLADEFERCRVEFRKSRLVAGSQGQPVINPLGQFMLAIAGKMQPLEDRFGVSPVARLRLSIDLGEAQKSLDAMNARLAAGGETDADEGTDPRLGVIDVSAS